MPKRFEPEFLYLTTTGWKTGQPHEIEIWFTERDGCCYLVSGGGERAHWVRNIRNQPRVTFRVGQQTFQGIGRVVDAQHEPELHAAVSQLSIEKYDWGEGLIVELIPD